MPPGVRILSLRDNPAQQEVDLRQASLDRLKSENEALLERLSALEAGGARTQVGSGGPPSDFVPRESWEVLKTEKSELVAAVEHKDKRIRRLQEVQHILLSFHDWLTWISTDLRKEKPRIQRSNSFDPWFQAGVQHEWDGAHDVNIRPQRRIRF